MAATKTTIDALILEIILDSSLFDQGQRDAIAAVRKSADQQQREHRQAQDTAQGADAGILGLMRQLTGLNITFAYVAYKSVEYFKNLIAGDVEIATLSQTLGISARELTKWQGMAEKTGGNADAMTATIQGLQTEINRFPLTQETSLAPVLFAFGESLWGKDGALVTATELMLKLAEARQRLNIPPETAATLWASIGIDRASIDLMLKGRAAMETYLQQQSRRRARSPAALKASSELWAMWKDLAFQAKDLGQKFMKFINPLLRSFYGLTMDIKQFFQWLSNFKLPGWARWVMGLFSYTRMMEILTGRRRQTGLGRHGIPGGEVSGTTGTSVGALGGTVHGRQVEAYGPPELQGQTLYDPVSGKYLGGGVGGHSAAFGPGQHEGVDIMTSVGTPTYSPFERGRVVWEGRDIPYGQRTITIAQIGKDGKPTGIYARFLHQHSLTVPNNVELGPGQQVGQSGFANAAHTHFEMWHGMPGSGGRLLNPRAIYGWGPGNLPEGGKARRALGPGDSTAPPTIPTPKQSSYRGGGGSSLPAQLAAFSYVPEEGPNRSVTNNQASSHTQIQSIVVRSQGDNAQAIARDLKSALESTLAA